MRRGRVVSCRVVMIVMIVMQREGREGGTRNKHVTTQSPVGYGVMIGMLGEIIRDMKGGGPGIPGNTDRGVVQYCSKVVEARCLCVCILCGCVSVVIFCISMYRANQLTMTRRQSYWASKLDAFYFEPFGLCIIWRRHQLYVPTEDHVHDEGPRKQHFSRASAYANFRGS